VAEENTSGTVTHFLYQPDGSRFATIRNGSVQNYFMPMVNGMVEVFDSTGEKYIRHADWLGSHPITPKEGVPGALGSSRLATHYNGTVEYDLAYAPYGETYAETGSSDRFFTGNTQDVLKGGTGIYDFLFREHSSGMGRWLTPDPAGLAAVDITNPQTWNRYAYVANNPLSKVDPLGLDDYDFLYCGDGGCTNITNVDVTDRDPGNSDRAQPPPKTTTLSWNFGVAFGQPGKLPPNFFKKGNWQCSKLANGGLSCTPTAKKNGFLNNLASGAMSLVGIDPTSDTPSCFVQFLKNTVNNANPLTPGPSSAGEVAGAAYATTKFNQALNYAATSPSATFGTSFLVYPFKSSVFRGMLEASQSGAMVGWLASIDVSMFQALVTEYQAAKSGECQ
jgi:RHS repeat-associated protein